MGDSWRIVKALAANSAAGVRFPEPASRKALSSSCEFAVVSSSTPVSSTIREAQNCHSIDRGPINTSFVKLLGSPWLNAKTHI